MIALNKMSIPELEREFLYCMSKADFISDFLDPVNLDFRVMVSLGLTDSVFTTFMVGDLYDNEMEKHLLRILEDLFRKKACHIEQEIRRKRCSIIKHISAATK